MTTPNTPQDQAIASGAAHVEETESLAAGHSDPNPDPREISGTGAAREDDTAQSPLYTEMPGVTLSMFTQGASTRVRVGNAHNASELYELPFDSIEEANAAMLDAGILTPEQVPDPTKLAGINIPLTGITAEKLKAAGLKRHQSSTI
jgi:hypothetical protein